MPRSTVCWYHQTTKNPRTMPDYSSLDIFFTLYNAFIKSNVLTFSMVIAKGICSLMIAVYYFRLFFSTWKVGGGTENLNFYQLFRPFFLVAVIVSYTFVMDTFDSLAKTTEGYVY